MNAPRPSRSPAPAAPGPLAGLRGWVVRHDESWVFTVLYVGLSLVLSVWVSLFWLVAVVGAHALLEIYKHAHRGRGRSEVLAATAWALRLDLALVAFALALSVYMETIIGVAGLGGAARLGARAAGWHKVVRGTLLSLDDAAQLARAAVVGGRRGAPDEDEPRSWRDPWTAGDRATVGLGAAFLLLLAAAPLLTSHTYGSLLSMLARELHPLP